MKTKHHFITETVKHEQKKTCSHYAKKSKKKKTFQYIMLFRMLKCISRNKYINFIYTINMYGAFSNIAPMLLCQ